MTATDLADPADFLGVQPTLPSLHFRHLLREAKAATGRSTLDIGWEMAGVFLGRRRIMAHEYFAHRLYDHAAFDSDARDQFVGVVASQKFNRVVNDLAEGHGIVGQKLMYNAMLRGFGLPTPRLQALARTVGGAGAIPVLADADAIVRFLAEDAVYPLFGKPVRASLSRGAVSVERYDPDTGALALIGGERMDAQAFAADVIERFGMFGYMLEERLRPHPDLEEVSGGSLGTVRFVTIVEDGRARPLYTLWKVPRPGAVADTTWRPGNMLTVLDPETGVALRCQRGAGPDRETPTHHPDTGAAIVGRVLPDWEAARETALKASELTPFTRLIGWDLALTDRGPVLVEANGDPNHTLYQLAADRGFLTPEATAFRDRVAVANTVRLAARRAQKKADRRRLFSRYFSALRRQFGAPPKR